MHGFDILKEPCILVFFEIFFIVKFNVFNYFSLMLLTGYNAMGFSILVNLTQNNPVHFPQKP